jgi:hypothetical protein
MKGKGENRWEGEIGEEEKEKGLKAVPGPREKKRDKRKNKEERRKDTQTPLRLEKRTKDGKGNLPAHKGPTQPRLEAVEAERAEKKQRREDKALPPKGPHPPRLEAVEAERGEKRKG